MNKEGEDTMFGHLQIKSAYSFQESTILIQSLIDNAKSKHIQALALTDDNNMYGAYEFYEACTKASIKPILGVNASIMFNDDLIHLLLYARDDVGYKDLVRIVSDINLNENKAITLKALSNYRDHLYIVSHEYEDRLIEQEATSKEDLLTHAQTERPVMSFIKTMKSLFGASYRIMIVEDGIKGHSLRNQTLIKYAQFLDIPCIWGNDVRYLHSHDAFTLDLLQASKKGEVLNKDHEPLTTDRYLKSEKEIREIFGRYPDIIKNTEEIIDNCYGSIQKAENGLPHYKTPTGDSGAYLRHLCIKGLKQRFKNQPITDDYKDRLLYELKTIHTMGYDDYFLIVFDYVQYAKKHGILVGPGRGSAAGSLVAYCLGITNIDPLKYDLLFERFLNPERVSMPDIDVDFQDDRRDEVIQYVCNKYGHDHVAQIVAFSTYGPRVAIKDIGKVMGIPLPRLEMIAKMVPTAPKHRKSITEVYSTSASFQDMIQKDPVLSRLIAPMSLVEYLPRNITMHAAGVVLSYEPLRDVVPLVIGPSDMIMSQYSKDYIEKTGLLKMDFLGLKNLTMIDYIMKDIERKLGKTFSINTIPLNDARTYHLISRGDTTGVFQLESSGMRSLLKKMKPECFDDIVAAIALYRPGPMENIPLYLEGRKNKNNITYLLKELEPILKSTYGIMIYQEQIMQIAQVIAGFSLGRADILRKAVSSKDESMMAGMKEEFIQGAIKKGFKEDAVTRLYQMIEKFANYGFNKSHSVAYGYVAYQLAYLKANYPLYFFASILSNESGSASSKMRTIEESKRYGVKILPPSINYSYSRFMVEEGGIRYSLVSIKNVGSAGYKMILKEREKGLFKDMYDFLARIPSLSSKMLESLIDAGAFDEFNKNRAYLRKNISLMMEYIQLGVDEKPIFEEVRENKFERLEREKEVLGLYISTHPIVYAKQKIKHPLVNLIDVENYMDRTIPVVCSISSVRAIVDKKGREMAFIEGQDETGQVEFVCFSNQYERYKNIFERGKTVEMNVRVQYRDRLSLIINQVKEL